VLGELPADDRPAVGVDHEREEDQALPAAQVGEVSAPELVRARRAEVALDEIRPRRRPRIRNGGAPRLPAPFSASDPLTRISRSTRPRPTCPPDRCSAFQTRQEP
jgi:hypothetical protein